MKENLCCVLACKKKTKGVFYISKEKQASQAMARKLTAVILA